MREFRMGGNSRTLVMVALHTRRGDHHTRRSLARVNDRRATMGTAAVSVHDPSRTFTPTETPLAAIHDAESPAFCV